MTNKIIIVILLSLGIYPHVLSQSKSRKSASSKEKTSHSNFKDQLARTPPMGWNHWNIFWCNINEASIKSIADAMVSSGMKEAGYEYVVVDDCWQGGRDAAGNLIPNAEKFPGGMKALADYVHAKGLKFGIYTAPGELTCAKYVGSLGHEQQDVNTFAAWGVDFLKLDHCQAKEDHEVILTKWRKALDNCGRPIVLSVNMGNKGSNWAKEYANMWRTTTDIMPCFDCGTEHTNGLPRSVMTTLDQQSGIAPHGPGGWNDPDMMQVGNGGMTEEENKAHFSLWALLSAPLMAGNDLRNMSASTINILTNKEVIAIDQDPLGGQGVKISDTGTDIPRWYDKYGKQVWAKLLAQPGSRAVVLLNRGVYDADITVKWSDLGLKSDQVAVRDLWAHEDRGNFSKSFTAKVPPHGAVMIKVVGADSVRTLASAVAPAAEGTIYEAEKGVLSRASLARLYGQRVR